MAELLSSAKQFLLPLMLCCDTYHVKIYNYFIDNSNMESVDNNSVIWSFLNVTYSVPFN